MKLNSKKALATTMLATVLASPIVSAEEVVNVYNWSDYIVPELFGQFEKETGIKVNYDVYDSNEVLEAKLLAGNSGFDVVGPGSLFLKRQVDAGIFSELDKSKLPSYEALDPALLAQLAESDPGNAHALPFLWGTTGLGYDVNKVKERIGGDFPENSWDLIFDPKYASKLKGCGISMLDAPSEVIPTVLSYLGKDPASQNKSDYKEAKATLDSVREYITYFHSSQYINDLANGDICVALGWSGNVYQAALRAKEVGNGVDIKYVIPKEGTGVWFDLLAIPADAKNKENAHTFINFMLRPDVIAAYSNATTYPNANNEAYALVDEELRSNPGVYPNAEVKEVLFPIKGLPQKFNRIQTRVWTDVKSGR